MIEAGEPAGDERERRSLDCAAREAVQMDRPARPAPQRLEGRRKETALANGQSGIHSHIERYSRCNPVRQESSWEWWQRW